MEVQADSEQDGTEERCDWLRLVARTPSDRAKLAAVYRALTAGGSLIACPKGERMRIIRGSPRPVLGKFKIRGRRGR